MDIMINANYKMAIFVKNCTDLFVFNNKQTLITGQRICIPKNNFHCTKAVQTSSNLAMMTSKYLNNYNMLGHVLSGQDVPTKKFTNPFSCRNPLGPASPPCLSTIAFDLKHSQTRN